MRKFGSSLSLLFSGKAPLRFILPWSCEVRGLRADSGLTVWAKVGLTLTSIAVGLRERDLLLIISLPVFFSDEFRIIFSMLDWTTLTPLNCFLRLVPPYIFNKLYSFIHSFIYMTLSSLHSLNAYYLAVFFIVFISVSRWLRILYARSSSPLSFTKTLLLWLTEI